MPYNQQYIGELFIVLLTIGIICGYASADTRQVKNDESQLTVGHVLQVTLPVLKHSQKRGVILTSQDGSQRYFIGVSKRPFIDIWSNGKWKVKWKLRRWKPEGDSIDLRLLHLGALLFLEIGKPGNLKTAFRVGTDAVHISTFSENHSNSKSSTSAQWHIHPLQSSAYKKPAGHAHKSFPGPATAFYMGWYPANYIASPEIHRNTDFPVYRVPHSIRLQVAQLAHYGWTGMAVDSLFFTPAKIVHQYDLMRKFMDAVKAAGLKHFHITPFLETKDPELTAAGVEYLLTRLGNSPIWAHWRGRPVIYGYGNQYGNPLSPEKYWKSTFDLVSKSGWNPFWVIGVGGLQAALYGTIDKSKYGLFSVADGVYDFSASGLEAVANVPHNIRKHFGNKYPDLAIGAFIHPGYLSSRTNQRNFISPRGTEFLRNEWKISLSGPHKPDFIGFSTWNDYTESTTLSQTYSILTSRLEISQRFLRQYRNQQLPKGAPNIPEAVLSYRKCIYQGEPITFEFLPLPTQQGPKKGTWHIQLTDEAGKLISKGNSPQVALNQMTPWHWELTQGVKRAKTRIIHIQVSLTLANGQTIHYANLPDMVVAVPAAYADQLYYSIPLSHLAGPDRHVKIVINGSDHPVVTALGLRSVKYKMTGPGAEKAQVASMRDSHVLRYLAPVDMRGAEAVVGAHQHSVRLHHLKSGQSTTWTCWAPTETDGRDYFAALARFPDGKWAYSPTVWTIPPVDPKRIEALWIFAPSYKNKNIIPDRSIHHADLTLPKTSNLKFIKLANNGPALRFNGKTSLKAPLNVAAPGPVTLEVLFRPGKLTGRPQVLTYQRGAQASLIINKQGRLVGRRLPELRKSHHPFVTVETTQPLVSGKLYDAVLSFDGRTLRLYVNGKLIGQAPCTGTRSTEGFVIGGPMPGNALVSREVDDLPADAFYNGDILRMSIFSGTLNPEQITAIYKNDTELPFWKGG